MILFAALLAQELAENDWWGHGFGLVLSRVGQALFFVGVAAGGIAGGIKIVRWGIATHNWGFSRYKERRRVDRVLTDLTSSDGWPNGANDLKASHEQLYGKVTDIEKKVNDMSLVLNDVARGVESVMLTDREKE
jgi:hypothetical protein